MFLTELMMESVSFFISTSDVARMSDQVIFWSEVIIISVYMGQSGL